jgi:ADP-ribose pyrophosphatase
MDRRVIFRGKKIQLALDTTALPDGGTLQREVVLHPGAVVILPLLPEGRVCLLRNYRHSVGETLLELPAGTLEPPEAPESAAVRELAEETGYRAARWRKLAEFYPSPGVLSERMVLFLAEDLTPGAMRPQPDEQLQPQVLSWAEALEGVFDGTIRDAKTLVGILLWDRLRGKEGAEESV